MFVMTTPQEKTESQKSKEKGYWKDNDTQHEGRHETLLKEIIVSNPGMGQLHVRV